MLTASALALGLALWALLADAKRNNRNAPKARAARLERAWWRADR